MRSIILLLQSLLDPRRSISSGLYVEYIVTSKQHSCKQFFINFFRPRKKMQIGTVVWNAMYIEDRLPQQLGTRYCELITMFLSSDQKALINLRTLKIRFSLSYKLLISAIKFYDKNVIKMNEGQTWHPNISTLLWSKFKCIFAT